MRPRAAAVAAWAAEWEACTRTCQTLTVWAASGAERAGRESPRPLSQVGHSEPVAPFLRVASPFLAAG